MSHAHTTTGHGNVPAGEKIFGMERGKLRKQGNIIADIDLFIACTCLYYDLILLTNNVSHFKRIDNLRIISL